MVKKVTQVVQHVRHEVELMIGPESLAELRYELGTLLAWGKDCQTPEVRSLLRQVVEAIDKPTNPVVYF